MSQDPLSDDAPTLPAAVKARIRTLDAPYMAAVRWVEELACNQSRQDKSWVARVERNRRRYFSGVRLVTQELERN